MAISFEKLVSRSVVRFLSDELDLAGVKTSVNKLIEEMILGGIALFVLTPIILILLIHTNAILAGIAGVVVAAMFELVLYIMLELKIESRKNFVDSSLPDYLQLVAANIRSGVSLDKAMLLGARPEFKFFSDDVKLVNKELYGGETVQNALIILSNKYRSRQLKHTIRMMIEALQYGGGMTDLLNQIAREMRTQATIQREVQGQMFMYTIFIAFASLIGAPVLYALTSEMIGVTDTVWAGILKQNPGGLPSTGVAFLRPSPPKITIAGYHWFAIAAVLLITGFGAFIVSVISSGSVYRGIRYLPIFIIIGLGIFFIVSSVIGTLFSSIGGA